MQSGSEMNLSCEYYETRKVKLTLTNDQKSHIEAESIQDYKYFSYRADIKSENQFMMFGKTGVIYFTS